MPIPAPAGDRSALLEHAATAGEQAAEQARRRRAFGQPEETREELKRVKIITEKKNKQTKIITEKF